MTIPPLLSGGVMLSYRCTGRCRHCLYRCSPEMPNEWMTPEMLGRVMDGLAGEGDLDSIHLAGGEPTLKMDLLVEAIRMARERFVPVVYVETNASWCVDPDRTRERMQQLREAGLPALLISVSMFHNEYVPLSSTKNCIEASLEVFGRQGTIVYMAHVLDMLEKMGDDGTHTLEEFSERMGLTENQSMIPRIYGLIPGGRVTEELRECYVKCGAQSFKHETCGELMTTHHFHVDNYGNLFTGGCAGIVVGTVDDLHPQISSDRFPLFSTLCERGPYVLMEMARERHGYIEREDGYVSKCDLCLDVRKRLHASGEYSELRPDCFYL